MSKPSRQSMKLKISLVLLLTLTSLLPLRGDITNGLVLYLPFDETTGLAAHDSTANANNGSLVNFSGNDSYWTNGWIAGALMFNAPNATNYLSVPDAASVNFTNQNAFTIAAWIKMPNVQSNGSAVLAKGT